nr:MAG TPA: hypothetical protein [Caudoviricetes sp.]
MDRKEKQSLSCKATQPNMKSTVSITRRCFLYTGAERLCNGNCRRACIAGWRSA